MATPDGVGPSTIRWVILSKAQRSAMARKIMDERFLQVTPLTVKLIKQLRPYVKAKQAGEEDVHALVAFVNMIKREAEDLKKESFGAEVSHSFTS
jgi:hypothetical protein